MMDVYVQHPKLSGLSPLSSVLEMEMMFRYMHIDVHAYTDAYKCVDIYIYIYCACTYKYTRVYTYMYIQMYLCKYVYTNIWTHTLVVRYPSSYTLKTTSESHFCTFAAMAMQYPGMSRDSPSNLVPRGSATSGPLRTKDMSPGQQYFLCNPSLIHLRCLGQIKTGIAVGRRGRPQHSQAF